MDTNSSQNEQLYRAAVGEGKADYYVPLFYRFDQPGASRVSWNWPAFFVPFFWMLYRRMYGPAFAYFILYPLAALILLGIFTALLGEAVAALAYWLVVISVRVLVPRKNDSRMVKFASYGAMQELRGSGVHFREMRDGFMHQKVMLVDDALATIGTHNFDARSMVLNFEVGALVHDVEFASRVEAMLEADFERSVPIDVGDLSRRPFLFRLAVRAARLTAPIQ